jgi:rhomboid protease GluP
VIAQQLIGFICMSEDKPRHPLEQENRGHPLEEAAPTASHSEPKRPQGIFIRFPGAVKTPYVTYALLAINGIIFVFITLLSEQAYPFLNATYIAPDAILNNKEFYRLLSGMFLHIDMAHMAFNMLALYYIGGNVERIFGHQRFALIYFLGGLLGSIAMLFTGSNGIGASGAIFAVWGAEMVFLYRHKTLFGEAGRMRLRRSFMMMLFNFLFGFSVNTIGNLGADVSIRIANEAHFGGLLGGAILAWLGGPRFLVKRDIDPETRKLKLQVLETNPLKNKLGEILFFCCGLAILILFAVMLRS